ncbi:MAG: hypothetical protein H7334_03225 [Ferruginibacter sp.]|nr:hypothetical protein [Ferruginibacter sp.]
MQFEKYEIEASSSLLRFEFYSIGPKGKVKKQVVFKVFEQNNNVFNIGFGDVDKDGNINDLVITGNQDSQKVLATVALTLFKFFEKHPHYFVFAIGSTKSRTRLYRIGISNNLMEIEQDFNVFGFAEEKWQKFKKDKDYEGFLIQLKNKKNSKFV